MINIGLHVSCVQINKYCINEKIISIDIEKWFVITLKVYLVIMRFKHKHHLLYHQMEMNQKMHVVNFIDSDHVLKSSEL